MRVVRYSVFTSKVYNYKRLDDNYDTTTIIYSCSLYVCILLGRQVTGMRIRRPTAVVKVRLPVFVA